MRLNGHENSAGRGYRHSAELAEDLRFIWKRRSMARRRMRDLVPAAFRERLMMVVTEVNGCRYCSYSHARLALSAGVSREELRLVGDVLDKRQYVLDQWVSLWLSYFLGCDFIAEHWGQARSCRARRHCVMINRRFNKRQRLIKQKVTLRLPRFHRKFLGARSLGTDNS
jgi:AhpD family alkylhydroperoxidase